MATVLFIASLAGSGVVGMEAAAAMVPGAKPGTALNPLPEAGGPTGDLARLRVPVGNLPNRIPGCLLALALPPEATRRLAALDLAPARQVANAHLAFNLAAVCWPFRCCRH